MTFTFISETAYHSNHAIDTTDSTSLKKQEMTTTFCYKS